jgi:thiamine-phosphate pyrophosphorylase
VFATGTKLDAADAVGLDGVRMARGLTGKRLVAIGGITRANARSVVEAGADGVAVISALVAKGERTRAIVEELLGILEG